MEGICAHRSLVWDFAWTWNASARLPTRKKSQKVQACKGSSRRTSGRFLLHQSGDARRRHQQNKYDDMLESR